MKKVLIATNLLWISIVWFQSCDLSTEQKKDLEHVRCVNYYKEPFNGISYETANVMFDMYQGNQKQRIGKLEDKSEDANSVWFSLETLKKFIYKIEDAAATNKLKSDVELGLRLYYGAYPNSQTMSNNQQLKGLPQNYQFHHTLFMMPTYTNNENKIHYDFNPSYPLKDGAPQSLISIKNQVDKTKFWTNPSAFLLSITGEIFLQNHGEVGPPPQVVPGAIFPE